MGSLRLAAILLALCCAARAEVPATQETIQSDISTREISIQSNFTGIEILIFGSVYFSRTPAPDEGDFDVIAAMTGLDIVEIGVSSPRTTPSSPHAVAATRTGCRAGPVLRLVPPTPAAIGRSPTSDRRPRR